MVPGMPNTYAVTPLAKMVISPAINVMNKIVPDPTEAFSVLYNPQSYQQSRVAMQSQRPVHNTGQQFSKMSTYETLSVELFLDTFSANLDVIGTDLMKGPGDALKFEGNSLIPSMKKKLDVRDYVEKIYNLCMPSSDLHMPPLLCLSWGSLDFLCFLQSCEVTYNKFTETGMPVRAIVKCFFVSAKTLVEMSGAFNSPDTSKFHTLKEGETINSVSMKAYDNPYDWREIAVANNIKNPRTISSGQLLKMPALK